MGMDKGGEGGLNRRSRPVAIAKIKSADIAAVAERRSLFVMDFSISAAEALARIASTIEQSLILILSDINMPGMTGLESVAA